MQDYEALVLATGDGRLALELVPAHGGIVNALVHTAPDGSRHSLLAGHARRADFELDRYYHGVLLYPFVNRLDGGSYVHDGKRYRFAINEPRTGNSLHGFLFQRRPSVEGERRSVHEAEVSLVWHYEGDNPGYPFPATITLHCHLHGSEGLTLTFSVHNRHHGPVPLAIGWHPYFRLGGKVDDWWLQLPPVQRVVLDERQLPTGNMAPFERFAAGARIGDLQIDECLELLPSAAPRAVCRLWSPASGHGLELWQQRDDYPSVHMFIPPDRGSVALEPVSGGVNCFNTGQHLRLLAADAVFAARCGVRMMPAIPQGSQNNT